MSNCNMKDIGDRSYMLVVMIHRDQSKRFLDLSQKMYLKNILERFNMNNSKLISTPVEKNHHLSIHDCPQTPE